MSWIRLRRIAVLGVCVLAFVGAPAPGGTPAAGAATCASPQSGHVAVVIDFEAAPGAPQGLLAECVKVSARTNGLEALRAAAGNIGQDSSGKVCQIRGIPARYDPTNCSEPHDGTISYWAYFHGSAGGWTYSRMGGAGWRVRSEVVEGWHFIEIPAGHAEAYPPPRNFSDKASYAWQSVCPASPVPTRPRPPSPPAPTAAPPARVAPPIDRPELPTPGEHGTTRSSPSTTVTPSTAAVVTSTTTITTASSSTSRPEGSALQSSRTAPRLNRAQVDAAADSAEPSSRPLGAILAGAGGIGAVVLGLAFVTRRSRRRRSETEVED